MKSFAVIGLGLFGTQLAKGLFQAGYNVLAIDSNEDNIDNIADAVTRAVVMDAKNREALAQLGIHKYDCVIVATSNDLANSVLITMNLKALMVPHIICKVQNKTDEEVLETLGASSCIIPEHIAADKLARKLTSKHIIDFTQLEGDYSIVEIEIPSSWVGKSIVALNVRAQYSVNIIALRHNGKMAVDFDPTAPLSENDVLFMVGHNKSLDKIQKLS